MKKLGIFFVCLLIVYGIAFAGSLITSKSISSGWFETIKPSVTPPSLVFPIVWNILYFLIALSLFIGWTKSKKNQKNKIAFAFGLNLALNLVWSVLFFGLKNPVLAFYEIIVLWFSIAWMIYVSLKIDKKAGQLLIPYLVWVSCASILNYLSAFG